MVAKRFVLFLVCGACVLTAAPASALFNSTSEHESANISPFSKWTGVLRRNPASIGKLEAICTTDATCAKKEWDEALNALQGESAMEQIRSVNSYINQSRYVKDIVNWGREDYWETLFEFFTRNGDCEDYAIAKYFSLKKLGFNIDNLRIILLQDQNLRVMHSVLAVYKEDKVYILDNQSPDVLEDKNIHHYFPIYSINERAWWRHLP